MHHQPRSTLLAATVLALLGPVPRSLAQNLYDAPPASVETRWISFENITGAKGAGGEANETRKGSFYKAIKAGETMTIAEIQGPGVIRRIWATVRKSPEIYRGLMLRIYWDDQTLPSVEAPIHDFFGTPFARQARFESALFASPEGKSYLAYIPMPFRKKARVTVENQSPVECPAFAFDLNYTIGDALPAELLYFHAHYRRENPTTAKKDFEILPKTTGRGRYLGANIGVRSLRDYKEPIWFGEGEIKIYLDGDQALPTLVGTGTEDLVGAAWSMGKFSQLYGGCLFTEKWLNFELPQDVCATAYWYQTLPSPDFGPIDGYDQRVQNLGLPRQ